MKSAILILVSMILFVVPVCGQSTLTFARVIDPAEMPFTSIAVVNPGTDDATVTFTLYGASGDVVAAHDYRIPSGGQFARLTREVFPGSTRGGWIQAVSPAPALRGFWLTGDFATHMDGAESVAGSQSLVLPFMTDLSDITLVNTDSNSTAVLIRLYGAEGQELAEPAALVLQAKGSFRGKSTELFSPLDWSAATHATVTAAAAVAGSVTVKNPVPPVFLSVVNAVNTSAAVTDLVFPHVVQGSAGSASYTTTVETMNLSSLSQIVTFTFTPEDGGPARSVEKTLAGNAGLRVGAATLFDFAADFQKGWVRLTGTRSLAGYVLISDAAQGGATAIAGISHPESSFIFGHIADLPPWSTGMAIVNAGASPAAVEIFAVAPDGKTIGTANVSIPPEGKSSRMLRDWIPGTQTRSTDGGFLLVRSTVPLYGLSVFFIRDLGTLSNVPALNLPPGFVFSPRQ